MPENAVEIRIDGGYASHAIDLKNGCKTLGNGEILCRKFSGDVYIITLRTSERWCKGAVPVLAAKNLRTYTVSCCCRVRMYTGTYYTDIGTPRLRVRMYADRL